MNNHNNKFFDGFLLGLILGGSLVFLFGTKTGKNLVKIISEHGLEGLSELLDGYDIEDLGDEMEEEGDGFEERVKEEFMEEEKIAEEKPEEKEKPKESEPKKESNSHTQNVVKETAPKKRFFKRFKK